MDLPRQPDDVLAQPSRARLFRELGDLRRPAGTQEMAARLDLHPNGVRVHLERLLQSGLVVRERSRRNVGRPRDMWSIAPGAQPGGDPPSAYTDLARWLAQAMGGEETGPLAVEAAGREIGRGLAPEEATGTADEQLHGALTSLGFAPERERDPAGTVTYRLCNCPYRDVARESRDVVCTLHRGVTRGLLDAIAPETQLTAFVARNPDAAGCLIELDLVAP